MATELEKLLHGTLRDTQELLRNSQARVASLETVLEPMTAEVRGLHSRCPEAGCTRLRLVLQAEAALAETLPEVPR